MHSKRRRQRTTAIAVAATMACLMAGFVLYAKPWQANNYNSKTSCPKDGKYPRSTAILIDATDSLGKKHIKAMLDKVNNLRDQIDRQHEWVGVFVLEAGNLVIPKPLIALCNPGNEQTANPLYQNPKQIQRDFEHKFAEPLRSEIEKLATLSLSSQKKSPIMEMIYAISKDTQFKASEERRLIVVSDMMQHTDKYSHYNSGADYNAWLQTAHAGEFSDLSLEGVEVEIWYVKRDGLDNLQTHGHVSFWKKFFDGAKASFKRMRI